MMLSQLKQTKSTSVPFPSTLAQHKVQQKPKIPPDPPVQHTKKAATGVHFKTQQLQHLPRRPTLVAPIDSNWNELVKFAKFSNKEAATETRQILRKQGLLL
uniref:Uncharacterized protein n=1 Tax=Amphimedon queenslandica TaxID=400682 RepID=A0A1X7V1I3_AMPQE